MMLLMLTGAVPTLVNVVVKALEVPSSVLLKLRLVGESFTAVLVPVTVTVCGVPGALSDSDKIAVREPRCVGVKVTPIMQLAPGASGLAQVLVWAKSAGSAPLKPIPVILSGAVPSFVSVTDCAGLVVPMGCVAKVRLLGDRVAFGPEITPVPLKAICCGLPTTLSVMVTEAFRGPLRVGLKVTVIVQLPPCGGRLEPQMFVWLKSFTSAPVMAVLSMLNASRPRLVRVTFCGALLELTCWAAKVRLGFDRETTVGGSRTETVAVEESAAAMSSLPSPVKSPSATELGYKLAA